MLIICLKANWFESCMLWYIVRLTQTVVFGKSQDMSYDLKHIDMKIK